MEAQQLATQHHDVIRPKKGKTEMKPLPDVIVVSDKQ